jgi:glucokinase
MYLGIEIGGTKLQLGVGPGDGHLRGLWRAPVDLTGGPPGIRQQILQAIPELLAQAGVSGASLRGVGVGFGGPVDDATRTVILSHQVPGWESFPLADWLTESLGLPASLGNDADVAGLAEALFGAGRGQSPVFYVTVGSGIGGGLILEGKIQRGVGRGAAEIGHLRIPSPEGMKPLEQISSGWAIQQRAARLVGFPPGASVTVPRVVERASLGDALCQSILDQAWEALAEALCHVIALLCPRCIVIGGGVSLLGERFFDPLRQKVAARVFRPFAGLTEIVPAALGEEVVVHGALALARSGA